MDKNKIVKYIRLKESIEPQLKGTIDQRVERYLEIDHQGIIGAHYFAEASSECINLYRDGYFIGAVMMSQAVNEGIIKFVAGRNEIERAEYSELMKEVIKRNIISNECAEASTRIWNSFRNDVHHMNPKVAQIQFDILAKRSLQDLAKVEKEVFGVKFNEGVLIPDNPQYWDLKEDGTAPVFLRLE